MKCVVLGLGQSPKCALYSVFMMWGMVHLNLCPLSRKGPLTQGTWIHSLDVDASFKIYSLLFYRKEISKILRRSYLDGMNLIFFDTASRVILFVTFTTYVLLGNMITVNQVFLAITLYQVVQFTGILLFPTAIQNVAETVASVRRIKVWWQITF